MTVYHYAKHTFVAVNKSISKELPNDAAKAFEMSRQLKPQRCINHKIFLPIKIASCGDGVYEIANAFVNNSTLNNIKAKARAEIEHPGHSFHAVGKYKGSVGQKLQDPFLIYKVNNKALDGAYPSFYSRVGRNSYRLLLTWTGKGRVH